MAPEPYRQPSEISRRAADRHAAERSEALAVERAVRDANVENQLRLHDRMIEEIHTSQSEMRKSLSGMERTLAQLSRTFETQAAVTTAISQTLTGQAAQSAEQSARRFSSKTLWFAGVAAAGAYSGAIVTIVALAAN